MEKYQRCLLKLANKLQFKYAQSQTLQEIIQNAASYGESSHNGIMNFIDRLKADQATLRINVTVIEDTASVSAPSVTPENKKYNYTKLSAQIKNYLDKNLKTFPQVPRDQTITLEYIGAGSRVAQH